MAMNLKDAFRMWKAAPRNAILATKSSNAVQHVLMKKYGDVDLEQVTPAFAHRVFTESAESVETKVKVASILVYLLQWGADHGYCRRPTFDYTIATGNSASDPCDGCNNRKGCITCVDGSERAVITDAAATPSEAPEDEPRKKPRGQKPKPIAQIDPSTLAVVKVWPSRLAAETGTGAHNIDRAVQRHTTAGGFFWCAPEEADRFKPSATLAQKQPASKQETVRPESKEDKARKPAKEQETAVGVICEARDEVVPKSGTASLSSFTDEELTGELERRGWTGELSRSQSIRIGQPEAPIFRHL